MEQYYPKYDPTSKPKPSLRNHLFELTREDIVKYDTNYDEEFAKFVKRIASDEYHQQTDYNKTYTWKEVASYQKPAEYMDLRYLGYQAMKGNKDLMMTVTKLRRQYAEIPKTFFYLAHTYGNNELCSYLENIVSAPSNSAYQSQAFYDYEFAYSPSVAWNSDVNQSGIKSLTTLCSKFLASHLSNQSFNKLLDFLKNSTRDIIRTIFRQIPMSNIKFWSDCYYYRGPGQELLTDVIDTWKYIAVIRADEGCYRLFEQQRMECIPPSSLISIYDQFDSFQFMPIDSFEESCTMFRSSPRPTSGPSVVDAATFLRQFDAFTGGMFRNFDWDRVVAIGGAVSACLLPVSTDKPLETYYLEKYPSSDIDLFIYGEEEMDSIYEIIKRIYRHICKTTKSKTTIVCSTSAITFACDFPYRHVQIVIHQNWESLEQLLFTTDVDCSGVAFDGTRVMCTQRARLSFVRQMIVPDRAHAVIRGTRSYFHRLLKYVDRGFAIADPLLPKNKQEYEQWAGKIDPKALESDFSQAFQIYNTATLLYMVHKLPALREIAHETEIPPVPFGPQWTAEKVFEELKLKGFEDEYPLSNYGYNTLADYHVYSDSKGDVDTFFEALLSKMYSGFYLPAVDDNCSWY